MMKMRKEVEGRKEHMKPPCVELNKKTEKQSYSSWSIDRKRMEKRGGRIEC